MGRLANPKSAVPVPGVMPGYCPYRGRISDADAMTPAGRLHKVRCPICGRRLTPATRTTMSGDETYYYIPGHKPRSKHQRPSQMARLARRYRARFTRS